MSTLRKRRRIRILLVGAGFLALSAALIGYAMRDGLRFFQTPGQVAAAPPAPTETFRLGGMVEPGSLERQGTLVRFRVSDGESSLAVRYEGITPDLFAEGEGVIATGRLVNGEFAASEILAKHDEDYMPRELEGVIADAR